MNEAKTYSVDFAGKQISFEFGKLAGQADAACVVKMGETMVLATVVTSTQQREGINFLPLTVDYEERMYAAGKISGSRFIKREGRPSEDAILNARIIDRSIRPLFPKGYFYDVQVVIMVLSTDLENDPGILAMIAASTVLHVSQIPWNGPVAGVKVGMVNDKIIACPTATELSGSSLDLTLAASRDAVVMVEAGAREIEEEKMEQAIKAGFESAQPVLELIEKIRKEIGKEKIKVDLAAETELEQKIKKAVAENLEPAIMNSKSERNEFIEEIYGKLVEELGNEDEPAVAAEIKEVLDSLVKKEVRKIILGKKIRPDSRGFGDIRPISCEVGFLPRVHGTGLFNRGQTQALTTVTLGSLSAAMLIDTMEEETTKKYMHFYNFPPFSTGEARPMRTASRREIGHGALAERALLPVIPSQESFPYTLRLVSEILSS